MHAEPFFCLLLHMIHCQTARQPSITINYVYLRLLASGGDRRAEGSEGGGRVGAQLRHEGFSPRRIGKMGRNLHRVDLFLLNLALS